VDVDVEGGEEYDVDVSSGHPIDANKDRYPFSIVWGPLPCITWILPFIGNTQYTYNTHTYTHSDLHTTSHVLPLFFDLLIANVCTVSASLPSVQVIWVFAIVSVAATTLLVLIL
jgi:hypothetical protein